VTGQLARVERDHGQDDLQTAGVRVESTGTTAQPIVTIGIPTKVAF
jgi:hypothetical protein